MVVIYAAAAGGAVTKSLRSNCAAQVRLFRADTPHDVASACLVAALSPGRDYLAISADKTSADPAEYLCVMRAVARAHHWVDVIDIRHLPITEHGWLAPVARTSRRKRYSDMRRSYELLSTTIGKHVRPDAIDQLFVTCLGQPDIQLLTQVVTGATISYLPHGLGNIEALENEVGVRWTTRPSVVRRARHALTAMLKYPIWGKAATPPLSLDIAASYTFYRYPDFGREKHDLASLLTPETMRRLFAALPPTMRMVYEGTRWNDSDDAVGLLLLAPSGNGGPDYPYQREVDAFVDLTIQLVARHRLNRIVIKPHPRNSKLWVSRVADAVRCNLPESHVTVITEYSGIPVEIAASAMNVAAAAGIGSTAVHTLASIYRIPTYSSDQLLRELNAHDANRMETWIRDKGDFYTPL